MKTLFTFLVLLFLFSFSEISQAKCNQVDIITAQNITREIGMWAGMYGRSVDSYFIAVGPKRKGQKRREVKIPTFGRGKYYLMVMPSLSRKGKKKFRFKINGKIGLKSRAIGKINFDIGGGKLMTELVLKQNDKITLEVFEGACVVGGIAEDITN